jgi:predicted component of type VI protein secretion system
MIDGRPGTGVEPHGGNRFTATHGDESVFRDCTLLLAVSARVPPEELRVRFPSVVKLGLSIR